MPPTFDAAVIITSRGRGPKLLSFTSLGLTGGAVTIEDGATTLRDVSVVGILSLTERRQHHRIRRQRRSIDQQRVVVRDRYGYPGHHAGNATTDNLSLGALTVSRRRFRLPKTTRTAFGYERRGESAHRDQWRGDYGLGDHHVQCDQFATLNANAGVNSITLGDAAGIRPASARWT
ncbi:MAG: hypothetical protein U5O39_18945 [Gammaproteobacteria bacterium]|nr:hypothetical protein [Gammaproteobacteria bacterium]